MNLQVRRLRIKEIGSKDAWWRPGSQHSPSKEAIERDRKFLIEVMNAVPNTAEVKRVVRIIELSQRAQALHEGFRLFFRTPEEMRKLLTRVRERRPHDGSRPLNAKYDFHGRHELEKLDSELRQTLSELNDCLGRYKLVPCVYQQGYQFPSLRFREVSISEHQSELWEHGAIGILRQRNGEWMDRVRRCKTCQKWFFAAVEHQTHCSDRCRQKRAATTEQFKEKRREYMREYRRREKAADNRAKSLARRAK